MAHKSSSKIFQGKLLRDIQKVKLNKNEILTE